MRVALDTNILAYAEGVNGLAMKKMAVELISGLPQTSVVLPVQVLGELFQVLLRKAARSPAESRAAILSWRDSFALYDSTAASIVSASDLVVTHKLGFWDSVILAVAAETGCRLLLSEDMQDGFTWNGVTIINPFARAKHPLLQALLDQDR